MPLRACMLMDRDGCDCARRRRLAGPRSSTRSRAQPIPRRVALSSFPRAYTPDRAWPVILAFDSGGRSCRTRSSAIRPPPTSTASSSPAPTTRGTTRRNIGRAVAAMSADVLSRFRVDEQRWSTSRACPGGARVAFSVALSSPDHVAGRDRLERRYPDDKPRKTLPFPVFATAGTGLQSPPSCAGSIGR